MCVDEEGKLDGPARLFRDGLLRREDSWSHGKPHGPATIYDEHGVLRERRFYQAGLLAGAEMFFHANGRKRTDTRYDLGVKSGAAGEWDERGRQRVSGSFVGGEASGLWWFAPPGEPVFAKFFDAGEAVTPLDEQRECPAWAEASENQRTLFVASLAALTLNALPPGIFSPAQPDPLHAAQCMEFGSDLVSAALDSDCTADPPELVGPKAQNLLADYAAKCLLHAARRPLPEDAKAQP
jgi:hypothetical protein